MNIGEKLKFLRESNSMTRKEAVDKLREFNIDISDKTLYGYESGRNSANADMFLALCKIYKCNNIMEVFSNTVDDVLFTNAEWELIEKHRSLDSFGQETVSIVVERELQRTTILKGKEALTSKYQPNTLTDFRPKQDTGIIVLPYFPAGASAGTGLFILGNEAEDEIELPALSEYEAADYAIDVKGRSMEPDYFDGDIALVNQYDEMSPGDVGVFIINGEVYVKELGNGELISHNHDYENIPIRESDNVVCMGKVIGKVI